MNRDLDHVLAYHRSTKHALTRFARGPGRLDWATQPDPFRRYHGAAVIPLDLPETRDTPAYELPFSEDQLAPSPLGLRVVSDLFFHSLAISAWKEAGGATWALRVNPSSGNLHPTEAYLICGPVPGLVERPLVAHYAPREHALEVRADLPSALWQALAAGLPPDTILVGLTSIHWREAWKYGERAFRYCQLDVGHAVAAISLAAAGLGWKARLLDGLGTDELAGLLGIEDQSGAEAEHADCLLAVYPQGGGFAGPLLPEAAIAAISELAWLGQPNSLSPRYVVWTAIDQVAAATAQEHTRRSDPMDLEAAVAPSIPGDSGGSGSVSLYQVVRKRRSAVAMDGRGTIGCESFYQMLRKTLPRAKRFPFNAVSWEPCVHLVLFVHRIEGLDPGLYVLVRDPAERGALQATLSGRFAWRKPPGCPEGLDLYLLVAGDFQLASRQLFCQQAIASDGCFSVGMLATFTEPLRHWGPWFYCRLFWECGMVGQVLYLEAEAAGVRGTGIGCFFDDALHDVLGISTEQIRCLYGFTVGYPVEDSRLTTLAAYPPPL